MMLRNPYLSLSKGENTSVIDILYKQGELSIIYDMPTLYVYTYHGSNTWDQGHFERLISRCRELYPRNTEKVKQVIST